MSLKTRTFRGELMDDPALDSAEHAKALRGLRRINKVTNSYRPLWKAIRRIARSQAQPLRILDVACGGGDSLIALGHYARKAGIPVELIGLDISPTALEIAQANCDKSGQKVTFAQGNALEDPMPEHQDVVYCSLFLHHLEDPQAKQLLKRMSEAAGKLMIVSDLLRTRTGYGFAWFGTRLLSRSSIVHIDGPRSVESALSWDEIHRMSAEAGLASAHISRFWPERFLLEWSPPRQSDAHV